MSPSPVAASTMLSHGVHPVAPPAVPVPVRGSWAPAPAPPERVAVATGGVRAIVGVDVLAVTDAAGVPVETVGVRVGVTEPGVFVEAGVFVGDGVDVLAAAVFVAVAVSVGAAAWTTMVPDIDAPCTWHI